MFKIIIPKVVLKELEEIDCENQKLVWAKIKDLENGIFTHDKALNGKHKGKFRKYAGSYRVIYLRENELVLVTVIRIAHCKEVY